MAAKRPNCISEGCENPRRRTGNHVKTGRATFGRLCNECHAASMREYRAIKRAAQERAAKKAAKRKTTRGRALASAAALIGSACSMLPATQGEMSELSAALGKVATDVGSIGMGMVSGDAEMTGSGIAGLVSTGLAILTGTGIVTAKAVNRQRDGRRTMRKEPV